jgi:phage tail tape-measure protein
MRVTTVTFAVLSTIVIGATAAQADGNGFVAGAGAGAVTGAIVGGPVGAAVGAGVGGIAGGAVSDSKQPNTVVIERPAPRVIEQDTTGSIDCSTTTIHERNNAGESVATRTTECP